MVHGTYAQHFLLLLFFAFCIVNACIISTQDGNDIASTQSLQGGHRVNDNMIGITDKELKRKNRHWNGGLLVDAGKKIAKTTRDYLFGKGKNDPQGEQLNDASIHNSNETDSRSAEIHENVDLTQDDSDANSSQAYGIHSNPTSISSEMKAKNKERSLIQDHANNVQPKEQEEDANTTVIDLTVDTDADSNAGDVNNDIHCNKTCRKSKPDSDQKNAKTSPTDQIGNHRQEPNDSIDSNETCHEEAHDAIDLTADDPSSDGSEEILEMFSVCKGSCFVCQAGGGKSYVDNSHYVHTLNESHMKLLP